MRRNSKNKKPKLFSCEKGVLLVLVVIFMLVSFVCITAILYTIIQALNILSITKLSGDELYAADAGVREAIWQIKYDKLGTTSFNPTYDKYDFTSSWDYALPQVNGLDVTSTITNVWSPGVDLDIFGPPQVSSAELSNIIKYGNINADESNLTGKLIVKGLVIGDIGTSTPTDYNYQINIIYTPGTGDPTLNVKSIGIWIPSGFTYVTGSSNLEDSSASSKTYSKSATGPENRPGGTSVIWSYEGNPQPLAGSTSPVRNPFPGVNPADNPMKCTINLKITRDAQTSAIQKIDAISWITTDLTNVPFAWDDDIRYFKLTSVAGDTEIISYTTKVSMRQLGSSINGDYFVIGNTLMEPTTNQYYRDRLYEKSSGTLGTDDSDPTNGIPANATIRAAFLYWSGWQDSGSTGSQTRVPTGDGEINGVWETMAVSFQGEGTNARANGGNITPALPGNWAVNDIWLCLIESYDNVNSTMPAGWTAIDTGTNNGTTCRTTLYWRRAVAGDTNPLVTHSGGSYITASIVGYRGCITTGSPFDVNQAVYVKSPASTSNNFGAGMTTTVNNDMIVLLSGTRARTQSATYTGTPTPTERVDDPNTNNYGELIIADFTLATAGPTGARTSNISSSINNGYQLSLKPNTTKYILVDETTTDDNDYVTGTTDSGGYMLFTFSPFDVPNDCSITNLRVYYRVREVTSATSNIRAAIKVGSTLYNISPAFGYDSGNNSGTSFQTYSYTFATNPKTNSEWTVNDIESIGVNGLQQFGVSSSDLNPDVRVSMVYAEVNYIADPVSAAKVNQVKFTITNSATGMDYTYDITADTHQIRANPDADPDAWSYACYEDVTSLVQNLVATGDLPTNGSGDYTLGHEYTGSGTYNLYDFDNPLHPVIGHTDYPLSLPGLNHSDNKYQWTYAGWSIIFIYDSPDMVGQRQLYLFDQFRYIGLDTTVTFPISGFLAPGDTSGSHLTYFVGEGDGHYSGESIKLNGYTLPRSGDPYEPSSGYNPQNNPFNSKSNSLGDSTISGVDIDTFYVASCINPGSTSATVVLDNGQEIYDLVFIILSFRSDITTGGTISYLIR